MSNNYTCDDHTIHYQGIEFERRVSANGNQTVICGNYTIVDNSPRGYLAIGPMGIHIGVGSMEKCLNVVASMIVRKPKCT